MRLSILILVAIVLQAAHAQTVHKHALPFVLSADSTQQSFVRIINQSDRAGIVSIAAVDDTGESFGPIDLDIGARRATQFTSRDLEDGNTSKGLSSGVGDGDGHWYLVLETELDIHPLAYVRTSDGFLTEMHSVVPRSEKARYQVLFFNPASNQTLASRLRIVNPHPERVRFTITATDSGGMSGDEPVQFSIPANATKMLTSRFLESRFGDGEGKWQLSVAATKPVWVMNLMLTQSGHITNLSLPAPELGISEPEPPPPPPPPPADRAPANVNELYARARGKKIVVSVNNTPTEEYRLTSTTRFSARDITAGLGLGGRWTYRKGARHQGNMQFNFDRYQGQNVGSCSAELLFSTRTSGRFSAYCTGLLVGGDGTFRIVNLF